jgi:NAD dependent epimerase/dehydratase family enzyme
MGKAFNDADTPLTRKVILRMAITLGAGGILKPYFNLLKFGLGGKQGTVSKCIHGYILKTPVVL